MSAQSYNLLGAYGTITNPEVCIDAIKRAANIEGIDIKYMNNYAKNVTGSVRYLDHKVIELEDQHKETDAQYMWVDTGYKCGKYIIYASFYKAPLGWEGAYIGTEDRLRDRLSKYFHKMNTITINNEAIANGEDVVLGKNAISEEEYNNLDKNKFCIELYKRLLLKEHWARKKGTNRLIKYLEAVTGKVQHNMTNGVTDGYMIREDSKKIIVNTGLIDEFMNDIYVCFDIDEKTFVNPCIMDNKADMMRNGFSREQIKGLPKPVKFYSKIENLIFQADMDDFDIEDGKRLNHIINERRFRFPEKFSKLSSDVLCSKLKSAIERAVKISTRDYKYVIPMYNIAENNIQFLIPLHIEHSIEEAPELVLVVAKIEGFYNVMTILSTDIAYDNARAIAKPGNCWLQPEEA